MAMDWCQMRTAAMAHAFVQWDESGIVEQLSLMIQKGVRATNVDTGKSHRIARGVDKDHTFRCKVISRDHLVQLGFLEATKVHLVQPEPLGKPILFSPNGEKTTDGLENSRLWHEWAKKKSVETEDYRRALESFTPGGSEFYKNPAACVEYIRMRLQSGTNAHRELARLRCLVQDIKHMVKGNVALTDRLIAGEKVRLNDGDSFLLFNRKIQAIVDGDGTWEQRFDLVFTDENRDTLRRLRPRFEYCDPDTTYQEDVEAYANALAEEARRMKETDEDSSHQ